MIRKRPLLVVGIASFQLACGAHESGLDPVATQPAKDAAVVDVQEDVQESMDAKEAGIRRKNKIEGIRSNFLPPVSTHVSKRVLRSTIVAVTRACIRWTNSSVSSVVRWR